MACTYPRATTADRIRSWSLARCGSRSWRSGDVSGEERPRRADHLALAWPAHTRAPRRRTASGRGAWRAVGADLGDRVMFRVRNGLAERTTLHWHGLHIPARHVGGPHQVVEPGALWEPSF